MLVNDTVYKTMTREKIDAIRGDERTSRSEDSESDGSEPLRPINDSLTPPNLRALRTRTTSEHPQSPTATRSTCTRLAADTALRKALKEMSPDDVPGAVRASGLRGRGGAGFPTALKWSFLPKDHPGPIYLCVNADESEPGTIVNRVQMEGDPHQIVEGIILSAYAAKVTTAYFYIRYEYPLARQRMQAAIDEAYAAGYLGKNILGSQLLARPVHPSRRRGLHLRRRDRPDREPGRQAGLAADQAAVSRRGRASSASRRSSTTSRRWPAWPISSTAAWPGSARSACRPIRPIPATLAAWARSSTASAATSTGRAATRPRWASPRGRRSTSSPAASGRAARPRRRSPAD